MDEREVARLYISEMLALLPVLQRHVNALGGSLSPEQRRGTAAELGRLAHAAADLSADFYAEDCASLAAALGYVFSSPDSHSANLAVLAPAADALTYVHMRIARMDAAHRILAPAEGERATAVRVLAELRYASGQVVPGSSATVDVDPDPGRQVAGPPSADVPQWLPPTRPLVQRPLPPPTTAALRPEELLPPRPQRVLPPGSPATSPATNAHPDAPAPATESRVAMSAAEYAAGADEPPRVPLSDQDLAILNAFKTGPLRRSTAPLSPETLARLGPSAQRSAHASADLSAEEPTEQPPPGGLDDLGDLSNDIREILVFEATGDLQEIQRLLVLSEQEPTNRVLLQAIGRIVHKLKGAAGTLGFVVLGNLAHAYEDHLALVLRQGIPATPSVVNALLRGLSELEVDLAAIVAGQAEDAASLQRMHALMATLQALTSEAVPGTPSLVGGGPPSAPVTVMQLGGPSGGLTDPDSGSLAAVARPAGAETQMRVDVRRMDDLMRRVSALAVNRAELAQVRQTIGDIQADMEHAVNRLGELSARLGDFPPTVAVRSATAASAPSLLARVLRGRPQEVSPVSAPNGEDSASGANEPEVERYTEYDQSTRALAEAVADVGASAGALRSALRRLDGLAMTQEGLATAIQQAVMQVRLVPLGDHLPRLRRTVRALAQQLGKSITFSVSGELTEIDRDVSDALAETLTQLARNAVAHGIESPDERRALGKPPEGNLWLRAYYSSNEVNIELGDDGRGINPDQVLASALLAGIVDADTARTLSPEQALNLIFEQGVTTVAEATTAAGHGIGMAEVAEAIARLRGTIQIHSALDQGTSFHIHVPISLSIVHALHIQVAGQGYAMPFASVVQSVTLPPPPEPADGAAPGAPGRHVSVTLKQQQVEVPLFALADLLGIPYVPSPHEVGLIVEFGRQHVALIVDGVVNEGEVVVRSLPLHLRRRAIRGAAVTPSGDVLLLLDVPRLAADALTEGSPQVRRAEPAWRPAPTPSARILVVDDSVSIRRAVQATLTHAGFEVQVARDGMEALEQILADPPRAVILDIEMPRLDGYELLGVLRTQERFAMLPVALLTSRGAERHRRHAEVLGADAYLVKPCPDDELVATVRRLIERT
jgi:chemosensory pili system protein ChpA (sensor histidine kinase/response regulator)